MTTHPIRAPSSQGLPARVRRDSAGAPRSIGAVSPPLSREANPDLTQRTGERDAPTLAGSDLARALRVYGGPTLETKRDAADFALRLSAGIFILSALAAMLFGGWGYAEASRFCWWGTVPMLVVFFEAAGRRNRHQKRIDDVDAAVTRAVMDAVAA